MTLAEATELSAAMVGRYAPDRVHGRWGEVIRAFPHRPRGSHEWRVRYHLEYPHSRVPAWGEVEDRAMLAALQARPEGNQNDA